MQSLTAGILLILPLLLCGCSGLRPDRAYVAGDRETFDLVAPVIRTLADTDPTNDPDLSGVNGRGVLLAVDTWEDRVKRAEESLE